LDGFHENVTTKLLKMHMVSIDGSASQGNQNRPADNPAAPQPAGEGQSWREEQGNFARRNAG
jgi:hypothetical protein